MDAAALLAHVYQRDQQAVRQMALEHHLVVDLLWLVGDLVAAPVVYLEQVAALREGSPDSPVREAIERWEQGYCPACGSWPALAEVSTASGCCGARSARRRGAAPASGASTAAPPTPSSAPSSPIARSQGDGWSCVDRAGAS